MNNMSFIKGIGVGMIVGSAVGMVVSPRKRRGGLGKAIKSIGTAVENVTETIGLG